MADQGGGSEKVLSFSIDYSWGEIEDLGCIRGVQKNAHFEIFVKVNFSLILNQIDQNRSKFK